MDSLSHKPLVPFLHLLCSVALFYNKSFLTTSWLELTPSDMGLWSHTNPSPRHRHLGQHTL